jgi:hypothetical protein
VLVYSVVVVVFFSVVDKGFSVVYSCETEVESLLVVFVYDLVISSSTVVS